MSKDLRFEKEDFYNPDLDWSSEYSANGKAPNQKRVIAKYKSKQNHIRRVQKRTSDFEHDIDQHH
jgi:hypothetical protein